MAPKQVAGCLLSLVMISLLVVSSSSLPPNGRSLKLRQEVNRKGPYIGLITVYSPKEAAFFHTAAFKPDPMHPFLDFSASSDAGDRSDCKVLRGLTRGQVVKIIRPSETAGRYVTYRYVV